MVTKYEPHVVCGHALGVASPLTMCRDALSTTPVNTEALVFGTPGRRGVEFNLPWTLSTRKHCSLQYLDRKRMIPCSLTVEAADE